MSAHDQKGFMRPCPGCVGVRLHTARARRDPATARVTRVMVCSACDHATVIPPAEQPGLCCPRCGDCRLRSLFTRHGRPGVTTRVRQCVGCGHRIRTAEHVESYAG